MRPEALTTAPGGDDGSYAMPLRLFEEHDWNDEESETWEDEDMWSGTVDANDLARAPATLESLRDVSEPQRYLGYMKLPRSSLFTIVCGANGEPLQRTSFG